MLAKIFAYCGTLAAGEFVVGCNTGAPPAGIVEGAGVGFAATGCGCAATTASAGGFGATEPLLVRESVTGIGP
jgi:hypothetical protein